MVIESYFLVVKKIFSSSLCYTLVQSTNDIDLAGVQTSTGMPNVKYLARQSRVGPRLVRLSKLGEPAALVSILSCFLAGARGGRRRNRLCRQTAMTALLLLLVAAHVVSQPRRDANLPTVRQVRDHFAAPPLDCRIMMRWWWFGPAVTKPELAREIRAMRTAGIGGFEILPVYPMALDDIAKRIHNLPYLSGGFLDALHFAADEGRAQGMRVDLTLTSGWPYGNRYLPVTLAAGMLRVVRAPVPVGEDTIPIPFIGQGEMLLAVFLVDGDGVDLHGVLPALQPFNTREGRFRLAHPPRSGQTVLFFISSRTGQMVKRPAAGGEGFVLDHYDRAAIDEHLRAVGDLLLKAFDKHPPYAVFSDSLEVYGSDWTPNFLQQFQQRRGYDLTPYLPALVGDIGPATCAIRHDWGRTLTELAEENYLMPIRSWAASHGTRFRSQNYGIPPTDLSSNALVDLAEGENFHWREFSETRWASSANHLFGRPVTSAETWTWLHSPAFRATPLDMKAEADLDFLNGINQIVGHGWPYSPPSAPSPGWTFYAAGALNDHNPWWFVMPQVARYLQRVSYALRQGKPVNDVAVLLPTDDAWANMTPDNLSVNDQMRTLLGTDLVPQILDAGFDFDYIDATAIAKVGIPYRILILPGIRRIPLSTLRTIQTYARHGGTVLVVRCSPSEAAGWADFEAQTAQIQQLSREMFETANASAHFLPNESQLGAALAHAIRPDVLVTPQPHDIGFVHRRLADGDLYFLANTSNQERTFTASFRVAERFAQWWSPDSGAVSWAANENSLQITLQPYESRILVFSRTSAMPLAKAGSAPPQAAELDLSADWKVRFLRQNRTIDYPTLHSWTNDEYTLYFSGQAEYAKTVELPQSLFDQDSSVHLDFGRGTPFPRQGQDESEMIALLDSPVREAAEVIVNGKLAGSVWHPPYDLDVTKYLHPGSNRLRILVGNLAINEMAGGAAPDYRLLNQFYGERFKPQDMDDLRPLPSGILGQVRLKAYRPER